MAPSVASAGSSVVDVFKRYYYYCDGYSSSYGCTSRWYDWGRWVVLGGIIFFVLLVMLLCACTARRRRRRGTQPMYGTGWMAPVGKYDQNQAHQMNNYNQGYQADVNPAYAQPQGYYNTPPPYGQQPHQQQVPQSTGTTFNPNDGYYGNQQYGVQQPTNTYQPGSYAPPTGPPPGK